MATPAPSAYRLRRDWLARISQRIDEIVIAREDDPTSPGAELAAKYGVHQAPFFITDDSSGEPRQTVYTVTLHLLRPRFSQSQITIRQPSEPAALFAE